MEKNGQVQQNTQLGIDAAEQGDFIAALHYLETAFKTVDAPLINSYPGYCLAKAKGQMKQGASLCMAALQKDPGNPVHYLNLGRVYLAAGQKKQAIQILRKGLKAGCDNRIVDELKNLGLRKEPVLSSLARDNLINKYLGMLFERLGIR